MPEAVFLNPERVVSYLDIAPGAVAADFGAGGGYYAIPLARKVGAQGKVYAFDVQQFAVDRLHSEARLNHLLQLEAVLADLERPKGSRLKDAVADFVLVASILHQADDKAAVLAEANRVLKPGRTLAVIEWDTIVAPAGPPQGMRLAKAKAKELAAAAGFDLDREFEAGSFHYGLLFRKR